MPDIACPPPPLSDRTALPRRSEFLLGWFRWYARRYLAKSFHGVRLSRASAVPDTAAADALPALPTGPLIVAVNHPSWWDPLVGLVLSERFPHRRHYAPIDAAMLARYGIFERFGFFGIEPDSPRGGLTFLRTALAIAHSGPDTAIWITVQGHFRDVRARPLAVKPGVGHLAYRLAAANLGGCVLPLALEYPFWNERFPEALARFGSPLPLHHRHQQGHGCDGSTPRNPAQWTAAIEAALTATQDALSQQAIARDPSTFETLIGGSVGVGGVYDLWRRLVATATGRRFVAAHDHPPDQPATLPSRGPSRSETTT